jgi:adenosylmethionine-8-amino-7-oxononanoate aminotransferase
MLFTVHRAHAPYCYRCPLGLERASCAIECLGDLERLLTEHGNTIAGVLVEPMLQGAGGMIMWPAEFLAGVRRLCDRHGVLLIADEVLTGFGRTGRMFACEHGSVTPDIICLSKALTAGYLPLAVTAVTGDVFDAFLSDDHSRTFFHGHSFTANPLACAVAVASFDLFKEHDLLGRIARLETQLREGLAPLLALPIVGDVRVLGGVGAVELVADKATKNAGGYLDQIGRSLSSAFLERGLLLRPLGNVLYFMPPYVITDDQVDWVIAQIGDVLKDRIR